ncbi:MAG: glycine oxidase ThiO [Nitrosomonas sp.]|nr:glycine oxidase ThiO [Nitrosomonas sp.]
MKPSAAKTQDAIIVGAGVIGLATALELLRQGARVSILERNRTGAESSWAGGGILSPICPWDYTDVLTQLTLYSASLFSEWTASLRNTTGIDPEYWQCGMSILSPMNQKHALNWCERNAVEIQQQTLSIPYSDNTNPETTSRNQTHDEVRALFLPGVAQIRNPRLMQALHQRVKQLGGQIHENCSVTSWTARKNKIVSVQSSCGSFAAENYIIAAGAWSKQVLGEFALNLDIHPINGQMLLFKFEQPPLPMIVVKENFYLIPRRDGHLLVGSTLEDTGFHKQTTQSVKAQLIENAQRILPQLGNMPVIRQWSGLRPGSPLNIPTIGRHPGLFNLYINSGHFRYGVTMAPASAEILVNEMTGSKQPLDTDPYQTGWSG